MQIPPDSQLTESGCHTLQTLWSNPDAADIILSPKNTQKQLCAPFSKMTL